MQRRTLAALCVVAIALGSAVLAQVREFDFYGEFRGWAQRLPPPERADREAVLARYRKKLADEGVAAPEVDRRVELIRTRRDDLEADFWNRFFTSGTATFNTAPNSFLVSVVEKRKPGKALDVGMGEGRNALYLAKLGWDVTGFDPADKAVALAQERAKKLGLKIDTVITIDRTFDFGKDVWDLILFSWTRPSDAAVAARVVEGLKPGGIVVFEAGRTFYPQNGAFEAFKALRILHYTDERAPSDFFGRQEMDVVRLVAEKPAS